MWWVLHHWIYDHLWPEKVLGTLWSKQRQSIQGLWLQFYSPVSELLSHVLNHWLITGERTRSALGTRVKAIQLCDRKGWSLAAPLLDPPFKGWLPLEKDLWLEIHLCGGFLYESRSLETSKYSFPVCPFVVLLLYFLSTVLIFLTVTSPKLEAENHLMILESDLDKV